MYVVRTYSTVSRQPGSKFKRFWWFASRNHEKHRRSKYVRLREDYVLYRYRQACIHCCWVILSGFVDWKRWRIWDTQAKEGKLIIITILPDHKSPLILKRSVIQERTLHIYDWTRREVTEGCFCGWIWVLMFKEAGTNLLMTPLFQSEQDGPATA